MTLDTLVSRVSYIGAGVSGPFAFPFRIISNADLVVIKRSAIGAETTLAIGLDYSVAGAGSASGTVTLVQPLAVGETLFIRRRPPLVQPVSIRNNSEYFASVHEDEFDRLVMQLQSIQDTLDRSFGVSDSYDPAALSLRLKPETGKVLAWASPTQLGNAAVDSTGLVIPASAPGRTVATMSAYFANNTVFNVRDFGAIGDAGADDTTAASNAIAAASVLGGIVRLPPGTYKTTNTLSISNPHVRVVGDGWNAILRAANATFHVFTLAQAAQYTVLRSFQIQGAATSAVALAPPIGSPQGQYGVFTNSQASPSDVTIENVLFSGADAGHGLNNGVLSDALGATGVGVRWRLLNNHVERLWGNTSGFGYAFLLSRGWNYYCAGNTAVGTAGRGRHMFYSGGAFYSRYIGNSCENFDNGNFVFGDYLGTDATPGCDFNVIANNTIKGGGTLAAGVSGIGLYGLARKNRVSGNVIRGFKGLASIEVSKAATSQQPDMNTIADNEICDGDAWGINIQGAKRTRVRANTITDVSQSSPGTYTAIKIHADNGATASDQTTVQGNEASGAAVRSLVGLEADGPAPTGTRIIGNVWPASGGPPFELAGIAAFVRGNDVGLLAVSGDRGDASPTLTVSLDEEEQRFDTALTANRTVTLSATNAYRGARFRIVRTGGGAFNLDVGGLKTIVGAAAAYVEVVYNGSAWKLTAYGLL